MRSQRPLCQPHFHSSVGGDHEGGRGDEGSGPGDHFDDPIFEKGNRRTTTARSGSATDALLWVVSPMIGLSV
jgi:hypothetical protein